MFKNLIRRKKIKQSLIGIVGNVVVPLMKNKEALTIFAYHNITNKKKEMSLCDDLFFINLPFVDFKKQIYWINKNYHVINFDDAFKANHFTDKPLAILTFDDGFKSVYDLAFPLMSSMGIFATIFLTGDHVANGKPPWISRLHYLVDNTKIDKVSYAGRIYTMKKVSDLSSFLLDVKNKLKEMTKHELLQHLREIEKLLNVTLSDNFTENHFLNHFEINELCKAGWLIGNHTQSHRLMSKLGNNDQFLEISEAQSALSSFDGYRDIFALPFGGKETFTKSTIEMAKKCGIKYVLTTIPNENTDAKNQYVFGRLICETFSFSYFKFLATGRKRRVLDLLGLS